MVRQIRIEQNLNGAGYYGAVHGRTTTCRHANNPYGHNPDCNCGWTRASQTVPYMEGDDDSSD